MNSNRESWIIWLAVAFAVFYFAVSEGLEDKVKLSDVYALTLRQGHMTNGRKSEPVPQMKCVGGFAWCWAFVPKVALCYNIGSDGYDVQWECEADRGNRFGNITVNCEGYDYPEDPYILEGSCGLEYNIDHLNSDYYWKYLLPFSIIIVFIASIAFIVCCIYSTCSANQHTTNSIQDAFQKSRYSCALHMQYLPKPEGYFTGSSSGFGGFGSNSGYFTGSSSGFGGFGSNSGYFTGSSSGFGGFGSNSVIGGTKRR